jgi:hypothetical protein
MHSFLRHGLAVLCLAAIAAAGCEDDPPSTPPLQTGDTAVSAFAVRDVNPNSSRYEEPVSPRDYLGRVSAWYFGHAT